MDKQLVCLLYFFVVKIFGYFQLHLVCLAFVRPKQSTKWFDWLFSSLLFFFFFCCVWTSVDMRSNLSTLEISVTPAKILIASMGAFRSFLVAFTSSLVCRLSLNLSLDDNGKSNDSSKTIKKKRRREKQTIRSIHFFYLTKSQLNDF